LPRDLHREQDADDEAEPPGDERGHGRDEEDEEEACIALFGSPPSVSSSLRTGLVFARVWPSRRMSAIWVMNSRSPESPSPQPRTTSMGPASVSTRAMSATTKLSTMAKTSALGMNRSTTELTGRIIPDKPRDRCSVPGSAFGMVALLVVADRDGMRITIAPFAHGG
jgi:hypothetical protein